MQHIAAVENYLSLEVLFVLEDVLMLYENNYHIDVVEKLIEVRILVLGNHVLLEEWIITTERTCEMALLRLKYLQSGGFAIIIDILLVGEAVESYLAVVGDAVLLHNLVDAVENEGRLGVVSFHRLVDNLSELRIVSYKEPRIDRNAVATYARTGLKNINTRVHITDADNLVNVHVVMTANTCELIGESDVDSTESVLNDLGHLRSTNVGNYDVTLTETCVVFFYLFANLARVGAYGTVVMM